MPPYIVYRSQQLESLLLSFSPDEEFRSIVDNFAEIGYPPLPVNPELVSFALLELVSNSIRAHREKGVAEVVNVSLKTGEGQLRATVLDSGRGFDPSLLPYDLDAAPEEVDIMSDHFATYRLRYGGTRFGMGIYVAKKTFRTFDLSFVDSCCSPCPWFSGKVRGTRIEMAIPLAGTAMADEAGSEVAEFLEPLEEASS